MYTFWQAFLVTPRLGKRRIATTLAAFARYDFLVVVIDVP